MGFDEKVDRAGVVQSCQDLMRLDLGYIYDYELHPTYYRRYHPDMIVQFEGIKTRGDATCKFRISMPSQQRPSEPPFAGYTGRDV